MFSLISLFIKCSLLAFKMILSAGNDSTTSLILLSFTTSCFDKSLTMLSLFTKVFLSILSGFNSEAFKVELGKTLLSNLDSS